jgi:2-polyprenyl-3-methyl-5-hydroxy-6-metoxy-1,4-benzoquinol methylase
MSEPSKTVEQQYEAHLESRDKYGLATLGVVRSGSWHTDPRHLVFALARYKFVAKMLSGRRRVLEVGCGDAWPVPIVLQEVEHVHGIDIDPVFIEDARAHVHGKWSFTCEVHDMVSGPVGGTFDAAYSLDVLEHIPREHEVTFVANVVDSLADHGVLIIGTPSAEAQQHASAISKAGHVNCKDAPGLRVLLERFFHNVFVFSMNDEVVHTGFYPMAQYLLALCVEKRTR